LIPRRICVVAGDSKVVPLLAALRAGVITDLVIDEQTATKLVEHVRELLEATDPQGEQALPHS
jgi:DNA-binding transcriptional regulator LsrR (DeoR family)